MNILKSIRKILLKEYSEKQVDEMFKRSTIDVVVTYENGVKDTFRVTRKPMLEHIETEKPPTA